MNLYPDDFAIGSRRHASYARIRGLLRWIIAALCVSIASIVELLFFPTLIAHPTTTQAGIAIIVFLLSTISVQVLLIWCQHATHRVVHWVPLARATAISAHHPPRSHIHPHSPTLPRGSTP